MLFVSSAMICLMFLGANTVGSSVKIEMTTNCGSMTNPSFFTIRCMPQTTTRGNSATKTIVSMQVTKNSDKPLVANIRGTDSIIYDPLLQSRVKAEGFIDRALDKTFLSVTFNEAVPEDSGLYTCNILYLDESLQYQTESSSKNVTITNHDLQAGFTSLAQKVTSLETALAAQTRQSVAKESDLQEQITLLAKQMETHQQDLRQLTDKVTTTVLFVALHNRAGEFKVGNDMIYSQVIVNEGGGYDGISGVFTAPVAGVYLLEISIAAQHGYYIYIDLKSSNGQTLTRLLAGDPHYSDFAETIRVVKLDAGEQVKPVISHIKNGFSVHTDRMSVGYDHRSKFQGYMLRSLTGSKSPIAV